MLDMPKILLDLSHNEEIKKIPGSLFESDEEYDLIFETINIGDQFPDIHYLKRFDLLILADIIPASNQRDHLFTKQELKTIYSFVLRHSGKVLLTTSSGGDSNYSREQGSIRALSQITGVRKFPWGELFTRIKDRYLVYDNDLIFPSDLIKPAKDHPIFDKINKLLLTESTYLQIVKNPKIGSVRVLLETPDSTYFRDFSNEKIYKAFNVPLIVEKSFDEEKYTPNVGYYAGGNRGARVLTIGSSFFMSEDKRYGISAFDNGQFLKNIIKYLCN
ncbi:MAG: hypothetical protein ACTSU2_03750 [Promethearchaeota archaeon]